MVVMILQRRCGCFTAPGHYADSSSEQAQRTVTLTTTNNSRRSFLNDVPAGLVPATVAKLMLAVAIRMPYVFIATVAHGLGTSVGRLGSLLGLAELVGLGTFVIGRSVDRGAHKFWLLVGVGSTVGGLLLMTMARSAPTFAFGFAGVTLGTSVYTVAVHAWIGNEVPYDRRGRVVGIIEMSWAMGVLLGAPIIGLIIALSSWHGPWALIGIGLVPLAVWLWRSFPDRPAAPRATERAPHAPLRITRRVILVLVTTFATAFGGTALFSTFGAWLEDDFSLSATTIGFLSIAIGLAELVASFSTIRFSDRWGKTRSARRGLMLMGVGAIAIAFGPNVVGLAVGTLVVAFLGFEFGIICMLSIASEVGPENRGAVMSMNGVAGTLARASSAALATSLYAAHGMAAAAAVTGVCAVVAVGCLSSPGIRAVAH